MTCVDMRVYMVMYVTHDVSSLWLAALGWVLPSGGDDWQKRFSICSNIPDVTKHLLFSHRGQQWNRLRFGSFSVESSH